jgi:hypothetical protein
MALSCGLGHADYGKRFAVAEGDGDGFYDMVAAELVEGDAGEGGTHFEASEASGFGCVFASFEKQ